MKINQVCIEFDEWEYPWKFIDFIKVSLHDFPIELELIDSIWNDANNEAIWLNTNSLSTGANEIEANLIKTFPDVDEITLKCFVRAASYIWR